MSDSAKFPKSNWLKSGFKLCSFCAKGNLYVMSCSVLYLCIEHMYSFVTCGKVNPRSIPNRAACFSVFMLIVLRIWFRFKRFLHVFLGFQLGLFRTDGFVSFSPYLSTSTPKSKDVFEEEFSLRFHFCVSFLTLGSVTNVKELGCFFTVGNSCFICSTLLGLLFKD